MRSLRTDLSVSIAASLAMLVAAMVGGQMLVIATTPAVATAAPLAATSCLERPVAANAAPDARGVARLCLSVEDATLTVDLTSATGGDLYTAWLAFYDRPSGGMSSACPSAQGTPLAGAPVPSQIDAATATEDGTVRLLRTLPGLRPQGNTELELLLVDHGPASAAASANRTRQLLSWDRSWSVLPASATDNPAATPRLLGCAGFWLRGGAELTEH